MVAAVPEALLFREVFALSLVKAEIVSICFSFVLALPPPAREEEGPRVPPPLAPKEDPPRPPRPPSSSPQSQPPKKRKGGGGAEGALLQFSYGPKEEKITKINYPPISAQITRTTVDLPSAHSIFIKIQIQFSTHIP